MATIRGTAGNDSLVGTTADDIISGLAGDDILSGGNGNDTLIGGEGADQLIGGAGTDTASYSGSSAITINLKTGVHTGAAAGDTFSGIEGFTGTTTADTFVGIASSGLHFEGAGGSDTMDYSSSSAGVNVNFATGVGSGGDAEGSTYSNIERVIGSSFADTLTTQDAGDHLIGGAGNDIYVVSSSQTEIVETADGGIDEIRVTTGTYNADAHDNIELITFIGTGDAFITGNTGDNTITGGSGNDWLNGGLGADHLIGGAGTDTVSYQYFNGSAPVTINLKTGVHTGAAEGDTFTSIERIEGTSYGTDTFVGIASSGMVFDGLGGVDILDFSTSASGVNVNLDTGVGSGGDADGSVFLHFERIFGSSYDDTFATTDAGARLVGGAGNDVYIVTSAQTEIVETVDGGIDEIRTTTTNFGSEVDDNIELITFIGTGNAYLTGNSVDNTITGGTGNDELNGGLGADHLIGGAGTDTATYQSYNGTSPVEINLKTGIHGGAAVGDTFTSIERFKGTAYADTFIGVASPGLHFDGNGGIDTMDYSTSSAGVNINLDTDVGSGGDAEGSTYANIERIVGSAHADTFTSSTTDRFVGGDGNDVYIVGSSQVQITEAPNEGTDEVRTAIGTYTLGANLENLTYTAASTFRGNGNELNNVITSGAGADILTGNAGNDVLIGNGGADTLNGGEGSDTASYVNSNTGVTIDLLANTASGGHATGDILSSIENLTGSSFVDTLTGNAGVNRLDGGAGTDILDGKEGDDILVGGAGADILIGGSGFDTASYETAMSAVSLDFKNGTFGGDAAGDTFDSVEAFVGSNFNDTFVANEVLNTLSGGAGSDTVSYAASSAAVQIDFTTGSHTGGDAEGDVLTSIERVIGSAYGDHFVASAAGQVLQGGAGDDTYVVNVQSVTVSEGVGAGTDSVLTSLTSYSLSSNIENLSFTGSGNFSGTGNAMDNVITGGAGNDTLRGGAGADILHGGSGTDTASYSNAVTGVTVDLVSGNHTGDAAGDVFNSIEAVVGSNHADIFLGGSDAFQFRGGSGDDTYIVTSSATTVVEGSNGGTDHIRTSLEAYTLGSNFENLTYTGDENFQGNGNSLNNTLTGGDGDDVLNGNGGADILVGGLGADIFLFDSAAEISSIAESDLIFDFSQVQGDRIDLTALSLSHFIGLDAFTGAAGEFRYDIAEDQTTVFGDADGDGLADFQLLLAGSTTLSSYDFLI